MNSRSGRTRKSEGRAEARGHIPEAVVRPVVWTIIVVLAAALLANSMIKEIGRDEQMYTTAGVLLSRGQMIYRDFSYPSQLPYHPLLLATLYRGLGTTHYLLAGRLVSALSDILVMVLILMIYRAVFGVHRPAGLLFGLAAATLYVFNPFVDYAAGYAWNHDVVILCVALAFWLLVTTDFVKSSRYWRVAAMGALLTIATCMRVTTALIELVFLGGVLWLAGGSWRNRSQTALPFSAAALVAALWPAWVIVQAPQAFGLNLIRIPTLYGRWLHEIGMTFDKAALTAGALLTPGYLVLLLLAGLLAWAGLRYRSHLDRQEKRKAVVAALLPIIFLGIAYIPPTMWHQYLAVPVPFVAMALAYPLVALRRRAAKAEGKRTYATLCAVTAGATLLSVVAYPVVLSRIVFVLVPEKWAPVALHRLSRELARGIDERGPVLTLGPLYPLEGGRDIYPELSGGAIVYRIADQMTAEERQVTRTVGPETVDAMVKDHPPTAVIVGVEPPRFGFLEEPLRRIAQPNWPRETYDGTLQVYRRP